MNKKDKSSHSGGIADILEGALQRNEKGEITLGDLVGALGDKGFALLMMILVLPNCVPVPVPPGVSTVFSLPLLFLAAQMAWGRASPWIPKRLMRITLDRDFLSRALGKARPWLGHLERNSRPRLSFLFSPNGERFVGAVWLVLALSISVPLPFTNFLPGVGILVSAFTLFRRDGLGVLIGFFIGALGVFFTLSILAFGFATVKKALML